MPNTNRRGKSAVYLTDAQIDLVLDAVNRLKIEMSEPGQTGYTRSHLATLERAESELLLARNGGTWNTAHGYQSTRKPAQ